MIYSEIGKTGLKIPPIIFGTSALGNLYTALDDKIKLKIVSNCFENQQGTVVFDSAGKYGAGLALEVLGKCLQELKIKPENVIISNKLAWLRTPLKTTEPTFEKGVWHNLKYDAIQCISYDGIIKCWEQGNKLLGENYNPALLSVHDPDEYITSALNEKDREKRFQDIIDAYKALSDLKNAGKIKAIGIGAKNWRIIQEISQQVELDWVMLANSMTLYRHPKRLIDFMLELQKNGISIINSAVFNAGFLIGGSYFDYKLIDKNDPEFNHLFTWRKLFFEVCNMFSVKPAHACIRFGMSHPAVCSVALNTSKPENVKRNIEEVQKPIPPDFFAVMKEKGLIDKNFPYV